MSFDLVGAVKALVNKEEVMILATSDGEKVGVRTVSPLLIDGRIIFYTSKGSNKYIQMEKNNNIGFCIGMNGIYQGEGKVKFLGSVFADENKEINEVYRKKYVGAFEEGAPGEDMQSNQFIEIELTGLKGWRFEGEVPVEFFEVEI